jgi:hypothetical protein
MDTFSVLASLGTDAEAGSVLGVAWRTVQNWRLDPSTPSHRQMPEPVRRLLLAIERDRTLVDVLRIL